MHPAILSIFITALMGGGTGDGPKPSLTITVSARTPVLATGVRATKDQVWAWGELVPRIAGPYLIVRCEMVKRPPDFLRMLTVENVGWTILAQGAGVTVVYEHVGGRVMNVVFPNCYLWLMLAP